MARIRVAAGATLALAAACALSGCGSSGASAVPHEHAPQAQAPEPAPEFLEVADDSGRKVRVSLKPKRVACAVSFASEMLLSLGHKPALRSKVAEEDIYPPEAKDVPTFDVDHGTGPNLEQLAAAQPDLVILSPVFGRFVQGIEERLKVPVLVLKIQNYAQIADKLRLLGKIVGKEDRAEEAVKTMRGQLDEMKKGLPEKSGRVLALFGTPQAFLGFHPDSYIGSLVKQLNGEVVVAGSEANKEFRSMYNFSLEQAVALDPDVILIARHGQPGEASKALQDAPAWNDMRAVKNKRVHIISERLCVTNPGPRATDALRELRGLLGGAKETPGHDAGR